MPPHPSNRRAHLRLLVRRQVVEHDDIAWSERGYRNLVDFGEKRHRIDRPIEHGGGAQLRGAKRRHDRVRLPVATGRVVTDPEATQAARVAANQIGHHP